MKNFFKQLAFGGFASSGNCDCETTDRASVLFKPQVLTPEQKAQARENIGVSQKQEVEVVLNDVGASLVDASVKTVCDAIDAGNTVVLYRNIEDGTRVYYQLRERKEDAGGGESLTFTYRSTVVIDDIILHNGGFFNGSIGHGTENLTADTVGAVPAPMTAEIGQAMCVTEVDEDGKPVEWGAADLAGGIKPVAKTEDMTQPVGVDELGGLWSVPCGSECSLKTKKIEVAVTEAVSEIVITFTREDAELWNKATRISVLSYCKSGTPWNISLQKTAVDGTVTALAFTGSIGGWQTDITHLLPIGDIATKIETNNHGSNMIGLYVRQLFDSNTATISFVLVVENGDPVPPGSYMKVFIEGVM